MLVRRITDKIYHIKWQRYVEDEALDIEGVTEDNILFCNERRHHTFPLLALCLYDYDRNGDIRYCRSGEHLRYCADIQCQGRYKCPGSYCLSISRLCDSIMDCPHGEDEMNCHNGILHCPRMIRCESGHCIHPSQLCDGQSDCPGNGEDERLCDTILCPDGCSCFGQSLECNISSLELLVGDMKHVRLFDISVIPHMANTGHLYCINASYGHLQIIDADQVKNLESVVVLDLSFNDIEIITEEAFTNMKMLTILLLSNNKIQTLPIGFTGVKQTLNLIDLSFNYIPTFNMKGLYHQEQQLMISLSSNEIRSLDFTEVTQNNLKLERQLKHQRKFHFRSEKFCFRLRRLRNIYRI